MPGHGMVTHKHDLHGPPEDDQDGINGATALAATPTKKVFGDTCEEEPLLAGAGQDVPGVHLNSLTFEAFLVHHTIPMESKRDGIFHRQVVLGAEVNHLIQDVDVWPGCQVSWVFVYSC